MSLHLPFLGSTCLSADVFCSVSAAHFSSWLPWLLVICASSSCSCTYAWGVTFMFPSPLSFCKSAGGACTHHPSLLKHISSSRPLGAPSPAGLNCIRQLLVRSGSATLTVHVLRQGTLCPWFECLIGGPCQCLGHRLRVGALAKQ